MKYLHSIQTNFDENCLAVMLVLLFTLFHSVCCSLQKWVLVAIVDDIIGEEVLD